MWTKNIFQHLFIYPTQPLTPVDPVKATLSTEGCSANILPMAPLPVTTLKTPGGNPASAHTSANRRADSRVYVAGFRTTVFPMANAGAIFQVNNIRGKFQGTIAPMTPVKQCNVEYMNVELCQLFLKIKLLFLLMQCQFQQMCALTGYMVLLGC